MSSRLILVVIMVLIMAVYFSITLPFGNGEVEQV
jgi:hypothetical protein